MTNRENLGMAGLMDVICAHSTGGEKITLADAYQMIDDLVRWGFRNSSFRYIYDRRTRRTHNQSIEAYYQSRWEALQGRRSPKGQRKSCCSGSVTGWWSAHQLDVIYTLVCRHAGGSGRPGQSNAYPDSSDIVALHSGYGAYVSWMGTNRNLISIETVFAAIINVATATNQSAWQCQTYSENSPPVLPTRCSRPSCPGHHMTLLYQLGRKYMMSCPICQHALPHSVMDGWKLSSPRPRKKLTHVGSSVSARNGRYTTRNSMPNRQICS